MAGGLDRDRLLKIERLADEVLRAQEDLLCLDRHLNGRREALGSFRRGEVRGGTQWVATEGQFLRLPSASAREWLSRRQEQTQAEVAQTRQRLKAGTQALLAEHPRATDLPPGVCQLLLQERRRAGAAAEDPPEEAGAAGGGAGEGVCEVPAARLLAVISAAIRGRDLETLKPGLVRAEVERACGLEAGSLDVRKAEINQLIVEEAQRCIEEADTPEKGPHRKSGRKRQREDPGAGDAKRARSSGVSGGPTHGPATAAQTDFLGSTAPLRVQVADAVVEAPPRVFASGACGFYSSSRVKVEVNGEMREAMCQFNLVVLDSRLEE